MATEMVSAKIMTKISKELQSMIQKPPPGIKTLMNEEDLTDIQAIIDGPEGTPYEGGSFRIKLVLGNEFPKVPPKGFFLTKIFHPNIAPNGDICVNTLKRDWKETHDLRHILVTIKCLLIEPFPESALNEEAGKLLLEDYEDYRKHARLMTSIHAIPTDDGHSEKENVGVSPSKKRKEKKMEEKKKLEKKRSLKRL